MIFTLSEAPDVFRARRAKSDRESVIIIGAMIERELREWLKSTRNSAGRLTTFGMCIEEAFSAGLIGKNTEHDLQLIREIRNAAAHVLREFSFEAPELNKSCRAFRCAQDIREFEADTPGFVLYTMNGRQLFDQIADHLMLFFMLRKLGRPPKECAIRELLFENTQLD